MDTEQNIQKVIAIDGPSASGKGTVAAKVAAALGFDYLDSGALYRLAALYAQKQGIAWHDEANVAAAAESLPVVFADGAVCLDGEDVSSEIRTEAVGMGASSVAKLPQVRQALLQRQRSFLTDKGLVADGRDMGSVVFPNAVLKVFLTADAQIRAQRRALQLGVPTQGLAFDRILSDIEARDEADRRRELAPLKQLPDALLLDTTYLNVDEAVKKVLDWYHEV